MYKYKNNNTISEHAPKAKKPSTDSQLGSFLAGLIDSDGHFSKQSHLFILFHEKDISVAYHFKKVLNHGCVEKVDGYSAYSLRCTSSSRLEKIAKLILNKLKGLKKVAQLNRYLIQAKSGLKPTFLPSTDHLLANHWLAGFIQAGGSFIIKALRRLSKINSRIVVQANQKDVFLLKQMQQTFSGYVGHREPWQSYYYSSRSFLSTIKLINYLDHFQVMGASLTAYWLWRKASLVVQNNKQYQHSGIYKLIRLQKSLAVLGKDKR